MATPFRLKRSSVPGKRPGLSDLQKGELALNFYDGSLFAERDTGGVGIGTTIALLTPWKENFGGDSIYFEDGNVGIKTTNPGNYALQVNGSINILGGDLYQDGGLFSAGVGISSDGTVITGSGSTTINFVGSAVSSIVDAGSGVVNVLLEKGKFSRQTTSFTASANDTTFSVTYTPGFIDVYVNGVRLSASDYTATNGTSVVLTQAAFAGDVIDITSYQNDGFVDNYGRWSQEEGDPNNIYYSLGNVGIKTAAPRTTLDVEGVLGVETTLTTVSSTAATTIDSLAIATYRSSRFQVQITQGSSYQSSDLMVIHDGTTASIIEYGSIATSDYLGSFTSTISGSNLLLQVTMGLSSSATVKVVRYAISI